MCRCVVLPLRPATRASSAPIACSRRLPGAAMASNPGKRPMAGWLESALRLGERNTLFGRIERVENDELIHEGEPLHDQTFRVGKLSIGAIHDFAHVGHAKVGVGALVSRYALPSALDQVYGSNPTSYIVFLRARLE